MIPSSISDFLDRHHARYAVMAHPTAYTAQQEAAASHVPGREWAKSVVCVADGQPILAVLPANCAVDLNRLQHVIHADSIRLAKEAEFANLYRDCELGAMPPFGPLYGQRVFVDKTLTSDPEIAFSGGSHHDAIRMPYGEFERVAQPTVGEFASSAPASSASRVATTLRDPVCGAIVHKDKAAGRSEHQGEMFYFCSLRCKMEFDDNPYAYGGEQM